MKVFTIGFTKKSAEEFFELLKNNDVKLLIDTRISNNSQLAGFTKSDDLKYFLDKICGTFYIYRPDFAPTKELLSDWRNHNITWEEYEKIYNGMMKERKTYEKFIEDFSRYENVCILCSEATPEHCHRRLLAELLKERFPQEIEIEHL